MFFVNSSSSHNLSSCAYNALLVTIRPHPVHTKPKIAAAHANVAKSPTRRISNKVVRSNVAKSRTHRTSKDVVSSDMFELFNALFVMFALLGTP